jgi:hypothetical protein
MRYAPSWSLIIAELENSTVEKDCFKCTFTDAVTNQAGQFNITLDDRNGRYSQAKYIPVSKYDRVQITLDGTPRFSGRVEKLIAAVDKSQKAQTLELTGRSDFGCLVDSVSSKHVVSEDANTIVKEIISIFNTMTAPYSGDPEITFASGEPNISVGTASFSFLWKRKSFQEMLMDVSNAMGSPTAFGGLNTFYDFWLDPTDQFYFEPAGNLSSKVDLGSVGGLEIKESKYTIDTYPVKNDIWTWGMNTAAGVGVGRIPLSLQDGFPGDSYDSNAFPVDSWTEGTATYYQPGQNVQLGPADSATYAIIGAESIHTASNSITTSQVVSFIMPMPFGVDTAVTNQPPNNVLNTYNETSMTEKMGQMSALQYYLLIVGGSVLGDVSLSHWIQETDVYGNVAVSPTQTVTASITQTPPKWQLVSMAFGPDSNHAKGKNKAGTQSAGFDWASVAQIEFLFQPTGALTPSGTYDIYFDAFSIVKPLVVESKQAVYTQNALRSYTNVTSGLLNWSQASIYGEATLEAMQAPQQYYEIKNIGRADIPAGYTFQAERKTLLARQVDYTFNKKDGWLIDAKGWEST